MERQRQVLESHIRQLAQQLGYGTNPGINIEIRDFLESHENVAEHRLTATEEGQYHIWVRLRRYEPIEAYDVFGDLVSFIEHRDATFYVTTLGDEWVRYLLLSVSYGVPELCFLGEITFSA